MPPAIAPPPGDLKSRPAAKDSIPSTPTNSSSSSVAAQYQRPSSENNSVTTFIRKCFKNLGEFCASQPWEVLTSTLFFLIITLVGYNCRERSPVNNASLNSKNSYCSADCHDDKDNETGTHKRQWVLTVTHFCCSLLAILHITYRFRKIFKIGSRLISQIASGYFIVTYMIYATIVGFVGDPGMSIYDGWFLIPLLLDMQKVTRMAQFALSSSHSRRIGENVGNGMHVLAPSLSLDSIAKILLFSLGWQTGIAEFGTYAWYAVVSVLVNALVYLILYPVGISLLLDLMCNGSHGLATWDVQQVINTLPGEEGQSPVVHRVKVIACTFLLIVHILCFPNFVIGSEISAASALEGSSYLSRNAEKVCLITLVLVVFMKFFFYEDTDEAKELRKTYIEEMSRNYAEDSEQEPVKEDCDFKEDGDFETCQTLVDTDDNEHKLAKEDIDRASNCPSNSTDEGISIRGRTSNKPRPPSSRASDDSSGQSWSIPESLDLDLPKMDQESQTEDLISTDGSQEEGVIAMGEEGETPVVTRAPRPLNVCKDILQTSGGHKMLTDEEILLLLENKVIRGHMLEQALNNDHLRGVRIRRKHVEQHCSTSDLGGLPFLGYNFKDVMGACCETVIGYMTMPVGVAGPLNLDGHLYHVPMATTEGCLVASVNRGCNALRECGVTSVVTDDGMTRGPIVRFANITEMAEAKAWLDVPENFNIIKKGFDSTSRFAKLKRLMLKPAGRDLYVRFVATTGDAMGMNMVSKATENALSILKAQYFPKMQVISLSGNFCTDKKPAAINWVEGRGKSVVCEATVPRDVVYTTLKTSLSALVELNRSKNLVGSALAGSIGGYNAQAANVVTAVFIATGQDAAQNVCSSNCLTQMEETENGDLYITVTMPSIEVGTVGGGTILTAQGTCLDMLGIRGSHPTSPGTNANQLARIVAATVLAGELSLMSALAAGHLVTSHLRHNRSQLAVSSCTVQEPAVKTGTGSLLHMARQSDDCRVEELLEDKLRS